MGALVGDVLKQHWPEYVIEVGGLGLFMISAAMVTAALEHPGSPARDLIPDPVARRVLIGCAMGLTAAALIYSRWGRRSGAHFNPAVTIAFLRLGKIDVRDALFYIGAQFAGGIAGILLAAAVLPSQLADPAVNYVATVPGAAGSQVAFLAELAMSFGLMLAVLVLSNSDRLARFTGLGAAVLVAIYISIEAPLSGMSMNPARTFGPTLLTGLWTFLWIYLLAPPTGMLIAAELYVRAKGRHAVRCAKLSHHTSQRCIFRCGYRDRADGTQPAPDAGLVSLTG